MTDLGLLHHFLGIAVTRDTHGLFLSQRQYVLDLLTRAGVWLRQLLAELHRPIHQATIIYCDNISAVYMAGNPVQHRRTKHIEIDIHFVREKVALGQVRVLHVPSSAQFADIFTKGLPTTSFVDIRFSLNVVEPHVDTAGDVRLQVGLGLLVSQDRVSRIGPYIFFVNLNISIINL
jgi:hypothetical protein